MLLNDNHINHNKAIKAMRTMAANFKMLADTTAIGVGLTSVLVSAFSSPSHLLFLHVSFLAHPQFGATFPVSIHAVQDLIQSEVHDLHPSGQATQDLLSLARPYPALQVAQVSAAAQSIQEPTEHLVHVVAIKPYPDSQVKATLRALVQVFIPATVAVQALHSVELATGPC